jgi:hypothetical protein
MMIHRFFSISLLAFFVLWYTSTPGQSGPTSQVIDVDESLLFISINSTLVPHFLAIFGKLTVHE